MMMISTVTTITTTTAMSMVSVGRKASTPSRLRQDQAFVTAYIKRRAGRGVYGTRGMLPAGKPKECSTQ